MDGSSLGHRDEKRRSQRAKGRSSTGKLKVERLDKEREKGRTMRGSAPEKTLSKGEIEAKEAIRCAS